MVVVVVVAVVVVVVVVVVLAKAFSFLKKGCPIKKKKGNPFSHPEPQNRAKTL